MNNNRLLKNYLIIAGLCFLILSPNFFYICMGREISSLFRKICFLLFSLSLLVIPFFIFQKNIKLYFIILLPFVILAPANIFFLYLYKYPLYIGAFSAVLETNMQEAKEFIYGYKVSILFFLTLTGIYISLYLYLIKKMENRMKPALSIIIMIVSLSYLCMTFLISSSDKGNPFTDTASLERFQIRVIKSYPFGIVANLVQYFKEIQPIRNHQKMIGDIIIKAKKRSDIKEKEIYVLIIGEAARYDHFSINNYPRNTSPNLNSINGLISFTSVCTSATDTRMSVPLLLTKTTPRTFNLLYYEPSFITFFKKAGFETHWISNFREMGQYDTSTSVFAQESDHVIYINKTEHWEEEDEKGKYKYDEELLPIFRKILSQRKSDKLFIILHTLGSHYRYDLRYPPQFDIFKPSMRNLTEVKFSDASTKELKINSYDNSILYTDYFISSVIKTISSYPGVTGAVIYIPDHGEDLFDDDKNLFGHGNREITKYVAHIPLFVWLSTPYKIIYPKKSEAVFKNRAVKISAGNLFYSVLDMADISYEGEDLTKSMFSSNLKSYHRYIISTDYKLVDCDKIQ
jgi:glucan phosphoethanolaminetransferase (alkaline phosphatase superfamily)